MPITRTFTAAELEAPTDDATWLPNLAGLTFAELAAQQQELASAMDALEARVDRPLASIAGSAGS